MNAWWTSDAVLKKNCPKKEGASFYRFFLGVDLMYSYLFVYERLVVIGHRLVFFVVELF